MRAAPGPPVFRFSLVLDAHDPDEQTPQSETGDMFQSAVRIQLRIGRVTRTDNSCPMENGMSTTHSIVPPRCQIGASNWRRKSTAAAVGCVVASHPSVPL